jgi:hypothetical protein
MTGVAVNQLLEYPASESIERVLWIDPRGIGLYAIDINAPGALPVFRAFNDVSRSIEDGVCRLVANDPWAGLGGDEAVLSAGHRARRDRSWAMIKPLVLDQPGIFQDKVRAAAIARAMADGGNKMTFYRLLRRYWQRGMTPNALLPDYDRCGGRGKDKAVSTSKRGRPAVTDLSGVNIDPEMRALFRSVVTGRFAVNEALDLRDVYHEMIGRHFSDSVIDERTGRQTLVPRADIPTFRQFG